MLLHIFTAVLGLSLTAQAAPKEAKQDLLIKLAPNAAYSMQAFAQFEGNGAKVEQINDQWIRVEGGKLSAKAVQAMAQGTGIEYVQPNYPIRLLEDYTVQDPLRRAAIKRFAARQDVGVQKDKKYLDNPDIVDAPQQRAGMDPLFNNQWGMQNANVMDAWKVTKGSPEMIVAVIDTGVDYTHEDLLPNLWRNSKEIANNGIDDDGNGYVDDMVGWDFVSNDNKPYDLAVEPLQLLTGGNPGHGTHCAGNVAARSDNGIGIAGVAPNVKIMSLRFISDKGQGTTADAIKAIRYAVDNGAKVLSNSWGSEGEDPADGQSNQALRDAIQYAQDKGTLFVAAAGNGHQGKGYDNDNDPKPAYPASYPHDTIISVAALDVANNFGSFSNWGVKSVDIGAPGVKVFSTTVGSEYSDMVIDKYGFKASWDGTSMATPHVAGAAALYWSAHPSKTWQEVKAAIMATAQKIPAAQGKLVTEGKLDVNALMHY
ncbi:S8 family peptidase [Bdellovibrio sp. HCB337]|uniref:S8 family peptidase n=1 Tax=Bdellovibrio sp. HCB337 TaxID=3394358 RepID=UPI0039A4C8B9